MRGGRRPGAGRKAELGVKREVRIVLVLSEDEHAVLATAAGDAGTPLAKWIRDVALTAARS